MRGKLIHTMLRVGNIDRATEFYCDVLGMRELRRFDNPVSRYTLVFIGYHDEENGCCLELTFNYDETSYDAGRVFGHLAIAVPNCEAAVETVRRRGGNIVREAGRLVGGDDIIAFCEDPEGNKIELIEKGVEWFR